MQEDKYRQLHVDFELTNNLSTIWRLADVIRGDEKSKMNQIISLLGYKYLSDNIKDSDEDIGYELNEDLYYENLLIDKGNVINILKEGMEQITQNNDNIQAADVFYDLFNLVDFEKYNDNDTWLVFVEIAEKLCSETMATIGEVIIFLSKFIFTTPRYGGIKHTEDIIKFITANQKDVENIYDPFADEATLLAEVGNIINVKNYYGQHPNKENCILAKITLLTNDVNYKNIFIRCNDITELINWDVKFDLCVCIPPFGIKDRLSVSNDIRFKPYAPRRANEFAYILDMLYHLDENGIIKILVPDGVLFSSPDKKIIKYLVDYKLISSVIGFPAGTLQSTSIPTALVTLDKKSAENGIYYLNMRGANTVRTLRKWAASIEDIDKYIEIFSNKEIKEFISAIATVEDISENEYNLSINRYVPLGKFEVINVELTVENINMIKRELKELDEELNTKIGSLFK